MLQRKIVSLLLLSVLIAASCSTVQPDDASEQVDADEFVAALHATIGYDFDPLPDPASALEQSDVAVAGRVVDVVVGLESWRDVSAVSCEEQKRQVLAESPDEPFECFNPEGEPELDDRYFAITVEVDDSFDGEAAPGDRVIFYVQAPLVGDIDELLKSAPRGPVVVLAADEKQPPIADGSHVEQISKSEDNRFLVPFPDGLWFTGSDGAIGPWWTAEDLSLQWGFELETVDDIAEILRNDS